MKPLFLIFFLLLTPYTPDDIQILGDIAWLENGHTGKTEEENRAALILTMAVVKNRVVSGQWGGDTITAVLNAKGQYASHTKNNIGKTDTPQWVYDMARDMLMFGSNVPDYVVFQSMQPNLGTVWKVIDGEYFATGGGHKHEGDNFNPEILGTFDDVRRLYIDNIRNPYNTGFRRSSMDHLWGFGIDSYLHDLAWFD